MKKYLASIGVYCYEKDKVVVECFRVQSDDWKKALLLHSEFHKELERGGGLDWLSHDLNTARGELDNADLQVDIVFTELFED